MNAITCPSCKYTLDETTRAATICPACGFDLTPLRAGDFYRGGKDLRRVARVQRLLLWFVLTMIVMQFAPALMLAALPSSMQDVATIGMGALLIGLQLAILFQLLHLMSALRDHLLVRILVGVLMFAPCVNILILILVNRHATRALRAAGLKVGLLGVKDEVVVRMLSANRCHICGYDLTGNVSGRCPECGAPTKSGAGENGVKA